MEPAPSYSPNPAVVLPALSRRRAPDVPMDVDDELMLHLNDPNWDVASVRTTRTSFDDFEMGNKRGEKTKSYAGDSLDYTHSDFDNESQVDTTTHGDASATHLQEIQYDDESPYPEVRAAVSSFDDPLMPVNTVRMWILGILYSILISGCNQFFSMRYPSVFITGLVAQLSALPAGKLLEYILPRYKFTTFGYTWSLNPGPFNIKEHTVITVMANVVQWGAYATDVIATQRVFYNQTWSFGYQITLCLSTQLIGYSFAGLVRQVLVWPSSMIWPGALVNAALFNTLHKNYGKKERKHMSRERFFLIVFAASFVWYWFPGFIFTALSVANWPCWIAPNNVVVNQLFGTTSGLGMGFLTFDWSMISYVASPLVVPWWAEMNTFASFILWFWIITPILYYKNVFFSKFLPISGPSAYDRFGKIYDPTAIVKDGKFDLGMYKEYSQLFLTTAAAIGYAVSFAAFSAVVVHTFLWYRHDIVRQLRRSMNDEKDVHSRLMAKYKEVPHFWYGILFLVSFSLGIVAIRAWPTGLPIWAYIVALLISLIFLIPCGIIQAITNQQVPLSVISELIIGYIHPGHPVAMMIFKAYGYIAASQAIGFSGDLKLGHYMKVPPRIMFMSQVVATTISVFTVVLVQDWMFANIPDMCNAEQRHGFSCPSTTTFATASLIWGGIGPSRIFSKGALYYPLIFFFIIGAIAPIPFYYLARRWPRAMWRYVNMPVFFNGVNLMPPASGINYSSWFAVGFIFQWFMRRFHFRWWMRYNYILSAALDSGVAIGIIVIFFTLVYPKGGVQLNWWGNTVWINTLDTMSAPFKVLAEGETFGPSKW